MNNIFIKIPVEILTKKVAKNKTNSLFYAGKNIARVKIANREYVLTTVGEYSYTYKGRRYSGGCGEKVSCPKSFTNKHIRDLDIDNNIDLWGWFEINVWENDRCLADPIGEQYSTYDEAMEAFINLVTKDLTKESSNEIL